MPRRDRKRPPARRRPFRTVRKRLLVVCEGEVTEPEYLRGFRNYYKNPLVSIEIAKKAGDPNFVVRKAKQLRDEADAEAGRRHDENLAFDEVWCVFDVDEHKRLAEALDVAARAGLHVALSNPCFELWIVLHLRESPGEIHRHACQRLVKTFLPSYVKRVDFAVLQAGYDQAVSRAKRLDADARRMGEEGRNPTTGVYRLTETIRTFDSAE